MSAPLTLVTRLAERLAARLAALLFARTGHRLCCGRIPGWTAHVGAPWRPLGEGGPNLYNAIWRAQQRLRTAIG